METGLPLFGSKFRVKDLRWVRKSGIPSQWYHQRSKDCWIEGGGYLRSVSSVLCVQNVIWIEIVDNNIVHMYYNTLNTYIEYRWHGTALGQNPLESVWVVLCHSDRFVLCETKRQRASEEIARVCFQDWSNVFSFSAVVQ